MPDGVPIEFLGASQLANKSSSEKLGLIIEQVKEGTIVILEGSLSPTEKRKLIELSMEAVDGEFSGIEFTSLDTGDFVDTVLDKLYRFIGKERHQGLTIIGNAEIMKKVKEDRDSVSLIAQARG